MSTTFHETFVQLANIKQHQYLSTQPGFFGSIEVGRGVYIRNACNFCGLGGNVRCYPSEAATISESIKNFFSNDQISLSQADIKLLGRIEHRLDRMRVLDIDLSEIFRKFREKEEGNTSTVFFEEGGTEEKEATLPFPPLLERSSSPLSTTEVLPRHPSTPLLPLSRTNSLEKEVSLKEIIEKEVIVPPDMSEEDFEEASRAVNTSWILKKDISSEENIKKIVFHCMSLEVLLTEEQNIFLARSCVALLKKGTDEDCVKAAKKIFLQYYLKNNKCTALPEEFMALFSIISDKPYVRDTLRFLRSSSIEGKKLSDLLKEFDATRWQECAFNLQGFSLERPKPWKDSASEESDRDVLQEMCTTLVSSCTSAEELLEQLEKVNLVLLFALSSHTYKKEVIPGMAKFKRNLRVLVKRLPALYFLLGKTIPSNETDILKQNNFRKLYQFLIGSGFMTRVGQEERTIGGIFSLWGRQENSKSLAGNILKDFDIDHLLSSLEQVRSVAIRESKGQRRRRERNVEEENFTVAPSLSVSLLPPEGSTSWEFFFNDELSLENDSWSRGQDMARERAEKIRECFKKQKPMIDFDAVVEAVRLGEGPISNLLNMYEDGGLVLLRDYVYPYCTLLRRAETPFDQVVIRKFVGGAASPEEIAGLGGVIEENQVEALQKVIRLMRPESENDCGGFLKNSVIQSPQTGMLTTIIESIKEGKQVCICNDTNSGKTTMAKLAPEIVSLTVPLVLHVAPFPEEGKGWIKLSSWRQLDSVGEKGSTTHFRITAEELGSLLKKGIPQNYVSIMKKSLFLMDEYDSKEYNILDTESNQVVSSLQDELYLLGCQRIVNMSATPNIETFENKLIGYRKKLLGLNEIPEEEKKNLTAHYTSKIAELSAAKEALLARMAKEWSRQISIVELTQKDPLSHIEQVFGDIGKMPVKEGKETSFLVEMPKFTLSPDFTDLIRKNMQKAFPNTSSAVLFRDSDGALQAHYTSDGKSFDTMSLENFRKKYSVFNKKPIVVCFYSQDSVGGDFGIFSNEKFVEGQCIVYPEEIAPSYAIFQNMRRRRHLSAGDSSLESSIAPVRFYMGEAAGSELRLTEEEVKELQGLPPDQKIEGEDSKKKQKLITKANITAEQLSRIRERSRLKMKVARKKQKLLEAILLVDKKKIEEEIDAKSGNLISKKIAKKEFRNRLKDSLENVVVTLDSNVASMRVDIIQNILSHFDMPIENQKYKVNSVQEREAVIFLREFFQKNEFASKVLVSKEPYMAIQKRLSSFYKREDSCLAMWVPQIQKMSMSRVKKDDVFHPVPDTQSVKMALQRVRGKKPESVIEVDTHIVLPEEKIGVKNLPPDFLIKAMIGAKVHDSLKIQSFFKRLEVEFGRAMKDQKEHEEHIQSYHQQIKKLKKTLLHELQTVTHETSPFQSIEQLSQKYGDISKTVRQLDSHLEEYEEYSKKM